MNPSSLRDELPIQILRFGAASIWLATGLLVLHPEYRRIGLEQLAETGGLPGWIMVATCVVEVLLGLRVLGRAASWLVGLQVGMVAAFSVILAVREPMLLAHPFGVLTKNIPLLAVLGTLWLVEREGFTRRARWLLRGGVAAIWITEGLFPKILFQQPFELELVAQSGLVPVDASAFLVFMGLCQIGSGVAALVLTGRLQRFVLACQLGGLVVLPVLVARWDPTLWVHPFGPLTKNLPIVAGTIVVMMRASDPDAVEPAPRPFLTARWAWLCLFSFRVPPEKLTPHLPPGVELDLRDGDAWLSVVALDFHDTTVMGDRWPGFTRFPDLNFRYYVKRGDRRGVAFIREIVPQPLVAWVARTIYREPFDCAPITTDITVGLDAVVAERRVEKGGRTHTLRVEAEPRLETPPRDSLAHWLKERSWGFGVDRRGETLAYAVHHPIWQVAPVRRSVLDVDFGLLYGEEWAFLNGLEPSSVAIAAGSDVAVFPHGPA